MCVGKAREIKTLITDYACQVVAALQCLFIAVLYELLKK